MRESHGQRRKHLHRRRGMAVLVVLGLLAITLAIGYSLMRTQATTAQLQGNGTRRGEARLAAQTGLAVALRKMHENGWAGVTSTLSSNVGPHAWYVVSYETGDAALTPSSPDYAEYPFRVTITAQGFAEDPAHPGVQSQHTQSAVVQLVRRALGTEPSLWTTLSTFSLAQWSSNDVSVQFPFRAEGDVLLLGKLRFWEGNPTRSDVKQQYVSDLNKMRLAGQPDNRPFSGNVMLSTRTGSDVLTTLQSDLGLTTYIVPYNGNDAPAAYPSMTSYQLYPGGKLYSPVNIQANYGSSLTGVVLGADPKTNPLGIFRSTGALTLNTGTKITGTLVADGGSSAVYIRGLLVEINAATLPALDGDSQVYQLPAALVQDDLRVYGGSGSKINGSVVVWDQYVLESGWQATSMTHTGQLIARDVTVNTRTEWNIADAIWNTNYNLFKLLSGNSNYFPAYMQTAALLNMKPSLTISPNSSGVKSHWQDWSQPVYVKAAADEGLRWNLIRLQDGS